MSTAFALPVANPETVPGKPYMFPKQFDLNTEPGVISEYHQVWPKSKQAYKASQVKFLIHFQLFEIVFLKDISTVKLYMPFSM